MLTGREFNEEWETRLPCQIAQFTNWKKKYLKKGSLVSISITT